MPLDPSIILRSRTDGPDYIGTINNALTTRAALLQDKLIRRKMAEEDALRRATVLDDAGEIDVGATSRNLMGKVGPEALAGFQHRTTTDRLARKKADSDARKAHLDEAEKRFKIVNETLYSLGENATAQDVATAAARLNQLGIPVDENTLPANDAEVPAFLEQAGRHAVGALEAIRNTREQLKMDAAASEPRSEMGKLMRDEEIYKRNGGSFVQPMGTRLRDIGKPGASGPVVKPLAPRNVVPEADTEAPPMEASARNPFEAAIARNAYGEPKAFRYDTQGNIVENPQITGHELKKAERGAPKVQQFNNTKDNFENERKLRNDFAGEPIYKAHSEVRTAYEQIRASVQQASPAGDLAAATKIMKLLDPGSVVRESELGMAMAASGLLDRVANYATNIIQGTKLTPQQRKDFVKLADELYRVSEQAYNAKANEYRSIAGDYGLSADRVVPRSQAPQSQGTFNSMPDAKQYPGKRIQSDDGTVWKSDGRRWIQQ